MLILSVINFLQKNNNNNFLLDIIVQYGKSNGAIQALAIL